MSCIPKEHELSTVLKKVPGLGRLALFAYDCSLALDSSEY